MAEEARIRVRLDKSGAEADLADLYRQMASAPSVRGGGGGGGAGGMTFGSVVGTIGAIGAVAGLGRSVIGAGTSVADAVTADFANRLATLFFGTATANISASRRAQQDTEQNFAMAVGLDPAGMGGEAGKAAREYYRTMFQSVYGPEERGRKSIYDSLIGKSGDAWGEAVMEGKGGVVGEMAKKIAEIYVGLSNWFNEWRSK